MTGRKSRRGDPNLGKVCQWIIISNAEELVVDRATVYRQLNATQWHGLENFY